MAVAVSCRPSIVYELRDRGAFLKRLLRTTSCCLPIYQPIYPSTDIQLSLSPLPFDSLDPRLSNRSPELLHNIVER